MTRWYCETCGHAGDFDTEGIKKHVLKEHDFDLKGKLGERKGVAFLDGRDFYSNTFDWKFDMGSGQSLSLTQVDSGKRDKDDPMRFE